jgi:hypothetical protein
MTNGKAGKKAVRQVVRQRPVLEGRTVKFGPGGRCTRTGKGNESNGCQILADLFCSEHCFPSPRRPLEKKKSSRPTHAQGACRSTLDPDWLMAAHPVGREKSSDRPFQSSDLVIRAK